MHVLRCPSILILLTAPAWAQNWPQWRGPQANGVSSEKGFPVQWNANENIAWKVQLPGKGNATPIVWDDHIFVTSEGDGKNLVLCFDRSGAEKWRQAVGILSAGKHNKGTGTNSSPVADGTHLYVYFKSGDLACLDFKGQIVWQQSIPQNHGGDRLLWDFGTSPVLTKDAVLLAVMQTGPSYLLALDKKDGKQLWKAERNLNAPGESNDSYTTPIVLPVDGTETIIAAGADFVTAHEAVKGQELWRCGGLNPQKQGNFRQIASPVIGDGIVFTPYARGTRFLAIKLGGKGDVTDTHQVWAIDKSPDVPCPIADGGRLFYCRDNGFAGCLEAKTGKELWYDRIGGSITASPVLAEGRIYVLREDGATVVLSAGEKFEILATNQLGEYCLASPAFSKGQILIRSAKTLFCIGKR